MTDPATTPEEHPASEPAPSEPAAPSVAFTCAMTAVETRCEHMAGRIDAHDVDGFVHAARCATNLWLAGRSACRRVLARGNGASRYGEAARSLLEQRYMALLDLFALADQVMPLAQLRSTLSVLHHMLTSAMKLPLVETAAGDPASEAKRSAKLR